MVSNDLPHAPRPSLPHPAGDRIAESLAAARLPRRDRDDVADELAAHFEDALEDGRDLPAPLREFGEPSLAGRLIGRGVRRRRRAERAMLRILWLFSLAVGAAYFAIFARLHGGAPESAASPDESLAAFRHAVELGPSDCVAPRSSEIAWRPEKVRAAFEILLASMYTAGDDGRLTAEGLRTYQAWRGKTDPSLSAILLEPVYFPNPARRGEVRREFERFLALASDPRSTDFEKARLAMDSSPRRSLRFVALQIPLAHLAAIRKATRELDSQVPCS